MTNTRRMPDAKSAMPNSRFNVRMKNLALGSRNLHHLSTRKMRFHVPQSGAAGYQNGSGSCNNFPFRFQKRTERPLEATDISPGATKGTDVDGHWKKKNSNKIIAQQPITRTDAHRASISTIWRISVASQLIQDAVGSLSAFRRSP